MNSPNVEKLIESLGALSELAYAVFTQMGKAGFNQSEALEMTKHVISEMIMMAIDNTEKGEKSNADKS